MRYLLLFLMSAVSLFAADEIHVDYDTGRTVYAARFQPGGNVFVTNGSSDEVWSTVADYDVTMTENGSGGHYVGSFDADTNIGDGTYKITAYEQMSVVGPADSDPAIYVGEIVWKDFAEDPQAVRSDVTDAHAATDGKIDTTDALITSSHSTTDGKIDTTDALITSSHSTTDGKIDTTDALITSSHSTTDAKIAATDAELAKVPKSDSNVTWNATALASINAEADTALTDYDPPTKTEMDNAHALLATEAKQDIIDTNVDSILVLTTWAQNVMEGDVWIDISPTPWQVVTTVKDPGGGVGGSELIRKDLKSISDGNVTSSNTRIDRTVEP